MLLACICGGFHNLVCTAYLSICGLASCWQWWEAGCSAAWLQGSVCSICACSSAWQHLFLCQSTLPHVQLCCCNSRPDLEHHHHSSSPMPFTALSSGLLPELQWTSQLVQSFSDPGSTSTCFNCPQSPLTLDLSCCAEVLLVTVFWNLSGDRLKKKCICVSVVSCFRNRYALKYEGSFLTYFKHNIYNL